MKIDPKMVFLKQCWAFASYCSHYICNVSKSISWMITEKEVQKLVYLPLSVFAITIGNKPVLMQASWEDPSSPLTEGEDKLFDIE